MPGGNTEILLEKLNKNPKVIEELKNFEGVIIGNSAGAIALSKGEIENEKFLQGLGIVNFYVKVHYSFKDEISYLIKDEEILCIPEDCWVIILKEKNGPARN